MVLVVDPKEILREIEEDDDLATGEGPGQNYDIMDPETYHEMLEFARLGAVPDIVAPCTTFALAVASEGEDSSFPKAKIMKKDKDKMSRILALGATPAERTEILSNGWLSAGPLVTQACVEWVLAVMGMNPRTLPPRAQEACLEALLRVVGTPSSQPPVNFPFSAIGTAMRKDLDPFFVDAVLDPHKRDGFFLNGLFRQVPLADGIPQYEKMQPVSDETSQILNRLLCHLRLFVALAKSFPYHYTLPELHSVLLLGLFLRMDLSVCTPLTITAVGALNEALVELIANQVWRPPVIST